MTLFESCSSSVLNMKSYSNQMIERLWDFMTWKCATHLIIFILLELLWVVLKKRQLGRKNTSWIHNYFTGKAMQMNTPRWKALMKWLLRPTGICMCAKAVKYVPWFHMIYSGDFLSLFYINYYLQGHCKNEMFFYSKAPQPVFYGKHMRGRKLMIYRSGSNS